MIDTWNPAVLNETTQAIDSWNPAELNQVTTKVDSWNPAILNESAGETPVVFEATITASFPEGATCTATDGTTTLTADDNPMAFSIPNSGTWTVACIANGVTLSEDVVITIDGQTETVDLTPVGATVTPTDSVPMLIACAGIGDSEITTIAGALADVDTLTAILESENAVDYLVRSTTFASDVTADSVAMTGIGSINYDANTLLADSTWLAAICNSTYFESVLNAKVPVMTSNTTPSGVASASSYTSGYEAYRVFNPGVTKWVSNSQTNDQWVQYQFTASNSVKKVVITKDTNLNRAKDVIIKGSNDGISWDNLLSTTLNNTNQSETLIVPNNTQYLYYQLYITNTYSSATIALGELQFYGRQDVNV